MNYKENCTKGPVYDYKNEVREDNPVNGRTIAEVPERGLSAAEREANAELIAEAFNVLAETGMTPRELAGLLDDLASLLTDIQNRDDDRPRELTHGEYDDLCRIVTSYEQAAP